MRGAFILALDSSVHKVRHFFLEYLIPPAKNYLLSPINFGSLDQYTHVNIIGKDKDLFAACR